MYTFNLIRSKFRTILKASLLIQLERKNRNPEALSSSPALTANLMICSQVKSRVKMFGHANVK